MFINRISLSKLFLGMIFIIIYLGLLFINLRHNAIYDDAYITYRYAANFANGDGLIYNKSEAVLGTTSPGYALLLGFSASLLDTSYIPNISLAINMFAIMGIIICIILCVYKLSNQSYLLTLLAPLLVLSSPPTLLVVVSGMEGAVYMLIIVASITCLIYKRWGLACLLAGITIWFRPEGAFLIALIGMTILKEWYRKKITWRNFILYGLFLVLPGIIYLTVLITIYNTILPQSIIAKSSGLYPGNRLDQFNTVVTIIFSPLSYYFTSLQTSQFVLVALMIVFFTIIPTVIAFIFGSLRIIQLDPHLWIVPALLLINVVFYGSRSTLLFSWYHANYHLLLMVIVTVGFGSLVYYFFHAHEYAVLISVGITSLLLTIPNVLTTPFIDYLNEEIHPHRANGRLLGYYDLLQAIGNDIPEDATIALPEIGYFGFYLLENHIVDTAGLVTPEVGIYHPVPEDQRLNAYAGAIPPDAIFDLQPDIIITVDTFANEGLYEATWFDELYTEYYGIQIIDDLEEERRLSLFVHNRTIDE